MSHIVQHIPEKNRNCGAFVLSTPNLTCLEIYVSHRREGLIMRRHYHEHVVKSIENRPT